MQVVELISKTTDMISNITNFGPFRSEITTGAGRVPFKTSSHDILKLVDFDENMAIYDSFEGLSRV